jgi:hypothetical protein
MSYCHSRRGKDSEGRMEERKLNENSKKNKMKSGKKGGGGGSSSRREKGRSRENNK